MGSDPGQATPDKGRQLVEQSVRELIVEVEAFSREEAPEG
jgi:creatinine amidohydrolase/Fe(II)-dependent formamide hydrolase-like protein